MAKLVKIYTSLKHRTGKNIKTYISGKPIIISFDSDLIAEVSEDILVDLCKNDPSISVVDQEILEKVKIEKETDGEKIKRLDEKIESLEKEIKDLKNENKKLVDSINEGSDNIEGNILKSDLQKMKVEELRGIAKEGNLLEEEWNELSKKDLVEYLFINLNKEG